MVLAVGGYVEGLKGKMGGKDLTNRLAGGVATVTVGFCSRRSLVGMGMGDGDGDGV